jgi:hypothetical protein
MTTKQTVIEIPWQRLPDGRLYIGTLEVDPNVARLLDSASETAVSMTARAMADYLALAFAEGVSMERKRRR